MLFKNMNYSRLRHKLFLLFLLWITGLFNCSAQGGYQQKLDCFSILVGKNASSDGSVIFGHNEDTGLKLVNIYKVPRAKHPPVEKITFENGGKISQVTETIGYIWINRPEVNVCDTYLNEFGVAIGSDGCPSREKNPELKDGGIVFWLRRIVAERAHSAREGIKIAGKLIDDNGYASSGRTYIIADPNEGWLLSVVNGKHWVARRVADDEIAVIPNNFTLGEVNLADTVNFYGSPDIIKYAVAQDWYDPAKDGRFHFARAYSNPGSLNHPANINRMWRGLCLVSGRNFDLKSELPFAVKPEKKVSVQDIMAVLRDHYEGTELDKSRNYTLGSPYKMNGATICSRGTQYGLVAHLRNWLPVEIGSLVWIAPYRPDVQAFSPWYSGIEKVPGVYGFGDFELALKQQFKPSELTFDRTNKLAFWAFVGLVDKIDDDYGKYAPPAKKEWNLVESEAFKKQPDFEKNILNIFRQNPKKAIELLTNYSTNSAMKIYHMANKMVHK